MEICVIKNKDEAAEMIAFLLCDGLFATPLTPGEERVIRSDPYANLEGHPSAYWIGRGQDGRISAAIGIREHANYTGIYEMPCIAVAADDRRRGVGKMMLEKALCHIMTVGGRGMLVDTSDHPAYVPMQKLLEQCRFTRVGHIPEFYYPGEGTFLYYRPLETKGNG